MATPVDPASTFSSKLTPDVFSGEQAAWSDWAFVFRAFARRYGDRYLEWMNAAVAFEGQLLNEDYTNDCLEFSMRIYADLALLCRGPALRIVKSCQQGNGLECWRELHVRYEGKGVLRAKGLLNHVLYYQWEGKDWLDRYLAWKELVTEYETTLPAGHSLPLPVKLAVLIEGTRTATAGLREQLIMRTDRWRMWSEVDDFISGFHQHQVAYTPARHYGQAQPGGGRSRGAASSGQAPMEIDAYSKGNKGNKGDKGNGKGGKDPYKGGQGKGHGQYHNDGGRGYGGSFKGYGTDFKGGGKRPGGKRISRS